MGEVYAQYGEIALDHMREWMVESGVDPALIDAIVRDVRAGKDLGGPNVPCVKCGAPCTIETAMRFEHQWYCGWPCFELDVNQAVDEVRKERS